MERPESRSEAAEETLKQISALYNENNRKPIPFYHLIIDPNNFGNTVQNCVNLSHLVSDNALVIEGDCDEYPQVRPLSSEERKEVLDKKGVVEISSKICMLSMEICQRMIERYNIQEPLLKIQHTE